MQPSAGFRLLVLLAASSPVACRDLPIGRVPCTTSAPGIAPLVVGDTARMLTGHIWRAKCQASADQRYSWQVTGGNAATVTPDGLVRGVRPGLFELTGVHGGDTTGDVAFVLPRDWQLRIEPESVMVRMGDSVAFRVIAYDSSGATYSFAPFTLYTPEFIQDVTDFKAGRMFPQGGRQSLSDRRIRETDTMPGSFVFVRSGVTAIIGRIGERMDTARVVVLPAMKPPPE
jgi:hypothetical protein